VKSSSGCKDTSLSHVGNKCQILLAYIFPLKGIDFVHQVSLITLQ
jgi:hypothetical protein